MNDVEFLTAFEECTLTPADWTHEAHVRMAWLYLTQYDYEPALRFIRSGIQHLNARVLKKDLAYHETITVAFARLIESTRRMLPAKHTLSDLKLHAPDLFDRQLSAVVKYYSRDRLFSNEARSSWIEPDLAPLPIFRRTDPT